MKLFFFALFTVSLLTTHLVEAKEAFKIFGNVMLRYEDETQHIKLPERERLRLIARLGSHLQLNDNWQLTTRWRTGLKNKQNVPAITIHKFNNQRSPDSDFFIDRLFVSGKWHDINLKAGKIPWASWQNTDMFWDRNLNPIGISLNYKLDKNSKLSATLAKPLDGSSGTVGTIAVVQWQKDIKWQDWSFRVAPWWVRYSGEPNARFARRDTELDNQFLRLAVNAKYQKWSFGLDLGQSIASFDEDIYGDQANEKTAIATEVKYGSLQQPGSYLLHLRYIHAERFSVITEFAQNATQRFGTSDISGWDFLVRRKMSKKWWLGARISHISRLNGTEKGNRLRVEMQYRF